MGKKSITTKEFDQKFDAEEDITQYLDTKKATKRVNVDFSVAVLKDLDVMANIIGVPRQSLIKLWIHERLQEELPRSTKKRRTA